MTNGTGAYVINPDFGLVDTLDYRRIERRVSLYYGLESTK